MADRRAFLRLLALGAAGIACTTNPPERITAGSPTPSPDPLPSSPGPSPSATERSRTLAWRKLAASGPPARREHTFTGTGDRALLFGGRDGADVLDDLWLFEHGGGWRRITASGGPSARFGHNAEVIDGVLYVFGGQRGGDLFNDLYAFDLDRERWRRLDTSGAQPGIRYGAGSIVDGRQMLISHGFNFASRFDDTRRVAPGGNRRWQDRSPDDRRPVKRCLHRCARVDDAMLLFGGQTDGQPFLGDTWVFDLERERWTRVEGRAPSERNLYAMAEGSDGRAWLFGGFGSSGFLGDTWSFNGARWRKESPGGTAPGARGGCEGATLDGSILIFGGEDGSGRLDDLWELQLSA